MFTVYFLYLIRGIYDGLSTISKYRLEKKIKRFDFYYRHRHIKIDIKSKTYIAVMLDKIFRC